jgi:uncharacterized protein (TIGR00251 family)
MKPSNHGAQVTVISVKVKPNARVSLLTQLEGNVWRAQLKSRPVEGKANEELLSLVARHFGCPKSAVSLKSGASARTKRIRIEGMGPVIENVALYLPKEGS